MTSGSPHSILCKIMKTSLYFLESRTVIMHSLDYIFKRLKQSLLLAMYLEREKIPQNLLYVLFYSQVTRDHSIVSIEELNKGENDLKKPEAGDLTSAMKWFCEKHTSERSTCICQQCMALLCPFCISEVMTNKSQKHKKHEIVGKYSN